jgi:pimeloyl-ACP methyl ester carboxylesterase
MDPQPKQMFLHGLEGNSQGMKATLLRQRCPHILIPDFHGGLPERMQQLDPILGDQAGWTLVGSSFGGLMGALFAVLHPTQVRKLVLLAPALFWPDFANSGFDPVEMPVIIYHGRRDQVVSLEITRAIAGRIFTNLEFNEVDDDHSLYQTVHSLDWDQLLE